MQHDMPNTTPVHPCNINMKPFFLTAAISTEANLFNCCNINMKPFFLTIVHDYIPVSAFEHHVDYCC